jgi:hypothetical protein
MKGTGTPIKFAVYPADSGIPKHLLQQAEKHAAYIAIYVGWAEGDSGFMLGTTKSPRDVPRDLARYNKRTTHVMMMWTAGQEIADRILSELKEELKPFLVRTGASWYNELQHGSAIASVRAIAERLGVWLVSTDERDQMLEDACTRAINAHKQLKADPAKGSVVSFQRGR